MTLKGSITTRGEYDDNIFLSSTNEIEDFITTVSPGISGQYMLNQNNSFDLLYGSDLIFHKKSTPFVEDEIRHNLKASVNLNPMEYFYFKVDESYSLIQIDTREPVRYKGKSEIPIDIRGSERFRGRSNNLAQKNFVQIVPSFKYPLGPASYTNLEVEYSKSSVDEEGINDKEEWSSSVEIGKSFSSATTTSLNYRYGNAKQTESQNYNFHSFSGKIIYAPTEHLKSDLASGFIKRITTSNEELDSWSINFNLTSKISPTMDMGIGASRSLEDNEEIRNAERGAVERTNVGGSLNYRLSERVIIKGSGFYQLNSFKQVSREDKLWGGSLDFTLYFSKYLSLILAGSYNKSDFSSESESENRIDKAFSGSSSIEFQPYEWLKFGSRIQSEERNSDAIDRDYNVKRYSFYGTIFF